MTLKDWATKYNLKEENSSREEIAELLRLADQKLADCRIVSEAGASMDHYHQTVYGASIPIATASLRAEGYRITKEVKGGHELLFRGLTFTVDKRSKYDSPLQVARRARNQNNVFFRWQSQEARY